jgi:hypothetical protein
MLPDRPSTPQRKEQNLWANGMPKLGRSRLEFTGLPCWPVVRIVKKTPSFSILVDPMGPPWSSILLEFCVSQQSVGRAVGAESLSSLRKGHVWPLFIFSGTDRIER